MKNHSLLAIAIMILFPSFKVDKACEYATSNMDYVKAETRKAISKENINLAKYHTYKAINAIEKSKEQMKDCGCIYAEHSIEDGKTDLILATRTTSLSGTRILLNRALEHITGAIESIEEHELHDSQYGIDLLAMNITIHESGEVPMRKPTEIEINQKIDASLENYRRSLERVINKVDCASARAFAENIHLHCEQQLLRPNLSEGKKYYNYRTKEITAKALEKLKACK